MSRSDQRGFLLIDKPKGRTSHDMVDVVRRITGIRKVGHAGTLDPMATGLLVLGVGRATRLLRFVQDLAKEYRATAVLGVATDTLDADGAVLARDPLPVDEREVRRAMERFVGVIHQVPPMVSAIRVGGRRLYEIAREGREIERDARAVEVYELELEELAPSEYPEVTFRVRCSKGTYVRTLADDIAGVLGGRAHLTALRRLSLGSLSVEDAATEDELDAAGSAGVFEMMRSPAEGLSDLPAVSVDAEQAVAVGHGKALHLAPHAAEEGEPVVILGESGELLAVYRSGKELATPEVVIP